MDWPSAGLCRTGTGSFHGLRLFLDELAKMCASPLSPLLLALTPSKMLPPLLPHFFPTEKPADSEGIEEERGP
ncbi:hypothetical protein THAOC_19757 [Thalassiosira oceanica]|uniref:Uncharacterized protein n=1 Tax=Thalassiosira oceanica TaxID=159749 RepID=K0SG80_THAOC|nr:hypothetical protein THAOC_19757 [Thalassiosira oceanica]|eukprot:EJK59971.1 hypothetical protein THAOC_19757 [Thalassiosira oceanica]